MQTEQLDAPSRSSTHPDVAIEGQQLSPAAVATIVVAAVVAALVAVLVVIAPLRVAPQSTAAGPERITSSNAFTQPRSGPERITSSNAFTGSTSGLQP